VGAALVAKVIHAWAPHLGDSEFRVLTHMALTAKDKPTPEVPAAMYFGSHDTLTIALPNPNNAKHQSRLKTVSRAIERLIARKAVVLVKPAVSGAHAVYRLTLDNNPVVYRREHKGLKKLKEQQDTSRPPEQDTSRPPEQDTSCPPEQDTLCPSLYKEEETHKETYKERAKEEGAGVRRVVAVPRARRERPIPLEILRGRLPELGPAKCPDHGLKGGRRHDGKPHCPICRRLESKEFHP
jgi:hypothetical protein